MHDLGKREICTAHLHSTCGFICKPFTKGSDEGNL